MHFLRYFLAAWLEFGTVTVCFLYWLAKRAARHIDTLDKPLLDQDSFQQLLSAAFTLQEQNCTLVNETKVDFSQTVSLRPEPMQMAHSDLEPSASRTRSAVPNSRDTRIPDEFFWNVAAAIAMVSLFALLFVSSHDRLSPLPANLEVIQQEVPFRRVLAQSDEVSTKAMAREPPAMKIGRNEQTVDAEKPGRSVPVAAHKNIVHLTRHSSYESEADMVAPDTVVRYRRMRSSVVP
jgi:hypothetical protein